jgi:hypothetical protein
LAAEFAELSPKKGFAEQCLLVKPNESPTESISQIHFRALPGSRKRWSIHSHLAALTPLGLLT